MLWYCDTSALVKRYSQEVGGHWFRQQLKRHKLVASILVVAEVPSALTRRRRSGIISEVDFYRGRASFNHHLQRRQYELLPVDQELLEQASQLIYRYPLAAYDATHLASALAYLHASGLHAKQFYFVTADHQLQRAAAAEGLQTANPNEHP